MTDGFKKGEFFIVSGATNVGKSVVLPNTCANYGFECDDCNYITQSEDDHIVTEEGDYLCLKCVQRRYIEKINRT